jgi:plasmid stability protein
MPSALHVRNLDDDLVRKLKARATRHGRSTEAEHREILRQVLDAEPDGSFEERAAKYRLQMEGRLGTPTLDLLREGRDER